ncbi:MAG TPA: hypothetical protein VGK29_16210 [Paludibaculum sp.]|jgi:hypothetical protein
MDTTEIVITSVFGVLLAGGLVLGLRQRAQVKDQVSRYAQRHGWAAIGDGNERLTGLLKELAPDERWIASRTLLAEQAPEMVYLFGYQANAKSHSDDWLTGTACLAQHTGRARGSPVSIISRTPVAEKLLDDRVAVGSEEFQRMFTVLCQSAVEAEAVVNPEVERILLRHAEKPGWYVTVMIANRQVLAASFWAVKDEEWDYLIELTRNLRAAVR